MRDRMYDVATDPYGVPCPRCGAAQWVECTEYEPHAARVVDALIAAGFGDVTAERAAVLAPHAPVQRWLPYPDADWSYETEAEAAEWDDDTVPTPFTICRECGRIEMSNSEDGFGRAYDTALWPCATARALGVAE